MPIAYNIIIIFAVVTLAGCAVGWQSNRFVRSANSSESWEMSYEGDDTASMEGGSSSWRSHRENQLLLRKEGGAHGYPVDCCPSTLDLIEPLGGINQEGMYVHLFSEGNNKQRFYELSCRQGVENRPCRFVDRKLHNQSRCVQKYSYTYAIVKQPERDDLKPHYHHPFTTLGTNSSWMLDYIRVRSGCSCEVVPKTKKRRNPGGRSSSKRRDKKID